MSAGLADHFGIATNFFVFAGLNLSGALLVFLTLERAPPMIGPTIRPAAMLASLVEHLRNRPLFSAFAIRFCILFAFIGTFTYVNFVLIRPPIGIGMMALGLVYFVFLPLDFTTPAAGGFARRFGVRTTIWGALAVTLIGLPLLAVPSLTSVAAGLTLVGAGTFFAQAVATGFVGHTATANRGAASGLYLAFYFGGGLVGSAILGQVFDRFGWPACILGIGLALAVAALLAVQLEMEKASSAASTQALSTG